MWVLLNSDVTVQWRVCRTDGNYADGGRFGRIQEDEKSEILIHMIHLRFTFMTSLWKVACATVASGVKRNRGVQEQVSGFLQLNLLHSAFQIFFLI
jgi:hypothetical protein